MRHNEPDETYRALPTWTTASASGAFATVWKGYDPELDTAVAVKVLADNWVLHADVRERFLSEARLLRQIESRRVVRVHDVGVDDNRPYFVMDYVNGGTLADRVGQAGAGRGRAARGRGGRGSAGAARGRLPPPRHQAQQPAARQTTEPVRVLVADLGSAKRLADASGYTVTTGTPAYMAPEQAGGIGDFDARADVYSLAVVTWELLTGDRPAPEFPQRAAAAQPGADHAPEIAGINPRVADLLTTAIDHDPDPRPQDAQTFAHALIAANTATRPLTPTGWSAPLVWTTALVIFAVAALTTWLAL